MQTYCDVEEAIAISNASIWSVQQMQNISNTIMTDERRREELRRVTFNRCDKKQ
jgi:hypothetical protein